MGKMNTKSFLIKKIGKRGNINIWLVDGIKIRRDLSEEFTNFGHHFMYSFIPKNEFWIDREHKTGEAKYYIDHMLVEYRLMVRGKSKAYAMDKADIVERKERSKSKLVEMGIKKEISDKEIIQKIHKNLLKEYSRKVKVWIVNGELVRGIFYIDFTEGGHDKVYSFIPRNEIWLDNDLEPKERKFVLLHELHERNLMLKHHDIDIKNGSVETDKNYTKFYGLAHDSASKIEYYCRQHPEKLDKKLKTETDKSNKKYEKNP
jgi:hypothetical protein